MSRPLSITVRAAIDPAKSDNLGGSVGLRENNDRVRNDHLGPLTPAYASWLTVWAISKQRIANQASEHDQLGAGLAIGAADRLEVLALAGVGHRAIRRQRRQGR